LVALVHGEFHCELAALLARVGSFGARRFDLLCDQLPGGAARQRAGIFREAVLIASSFLNSLGSMNGLLIRYALIFATVIQQIAGAGSCCCFANALMGCASEHSVVHSIEPQRAGPKSVCSKCKVKARDARAHESKARENKAMELGGHCGQEVHSKGCSCRLVAQQTFVSTERWELKSTSQGLCSGFLSLGFQIPSSWEDLAYRLSILSGGLFFAGQLAPAPMMYRLSWLSVWMI
jgi:hypothetical protein